NRFMDTVASLADPTRRQIVELLARDGPISVAEIVAPFPLPPPAISQHLKVLREAHLLLMDKRAQQRIYRVNPDALLELEDWARRLGQLLKARFDAFEKVLEAEKSKLEHDDSQREQPRHSLRSPLIVKN